MRRTQGRQQTVRTDSTNCNMAAIPCLAVPCLALPCLALPCLALPGLTAASSVHMSTLGLPTLAPCRAVACRAVTCRDVTWLTCAFGCARTLADCIISDDVLVLVCSRLAACRLVYCSSPRHGCIQVVQLNVPADDITYGTLCLSSLPPPFSHAVNTTQHPECARARVGVWVFGYLGVSRAGLKEDAICSKALTFLRTM